MTTTEEAWQAWQASKVFTFDKDAEPLSYKASNELITMPKFLLLKLKAENKELKQQLADTIEGRDNWHEGWVKQQKELAEALKGQDRFMKKIAEMEKDSIPKAKVQELDFPLYRIREFMFELQKKDKQWEYSDETFFIVGFQEGQKETKKELLSAGEKGK